MQVPIMRCSTHSELLQGMQKRRKQFELWQAVKCDVRIKPVSWEYVLVQTRECLSEWAVRVKVDRIDDDAEDEHDKEVMCDCFFPHCKASFGSSPRRRRTKCEVRRDTFDKQYIVVAESDAIHMQCSVVSFKTARRRVLQTSSRIVCDSCGRSVSVQGCSQILVSRNSSKSSSFALMFDDGWY